MTTQDQVTVASALPRHLAIIMDGNGRWAKERGLPRTEGHRAGAKAVHRTVRACRRLGIEVLTLYAFSEQNWGRPTEEVEALMELLLAYVVDERDEILENQIRLVAIGDLTRLPDDVAEALQALMDESKDNQGMILALALSYGSREELTRAAQRLATKVAQGTLRPEEVDAAALDAELYTAGWPEPDLLIRTSGEQRLSNFLLWQLAYAELYFTSVPWPDFDEAALDRALATFTSRERRFGLTGEQLLDAPQDAAEGEKPC